LGIAWLQQHFAVSAVTHNILLIKLLVNVRSLIGITIQ
jgi:hypothetical protein